MSEMFENRQGQDLSRYDVYRLSLSATETKPINPPVTHLLSVVENGLLRIASGVYGKDFHGITPDYAAAILAEDFTGEQP